MIGFSIGVASYLAFGFAVIGFIIAREEHSDSYSAKEYIGTAVLWPLFLLFIFFEKLDDVGDVTPYLRKVFGGPRKG